jgi:hypothetical protein
MVKQGKDWAVAATPALGQMREKGREEFLAAVRKSRQVLCASKEPVSMAQFD